jgi:hypothetical protein
MALRSSKRARASRPEGTRALRVVADRVGIMAEYVDQTGKERRATSDRTRVALLAAMGYEASSEEGAKKTLSALRER